MFYMRKQKLDFGKYTGKSIAFVLETDPSYLIWMHENTSYKLSEKIYVEAKELTDDQNEAFGEPCDTYGTFE